MDGEYQYGFSRNRKLTSFNRENRLRKARTILAILRAEFGSELTNKHVVDIGASTGFIGNYLAEHVQSLIGIDIDEEAIAHATSICTQQNAEFRIGDAMQTDFEDASVDVVLCTHIYEHVPDDRKLMAEIRRILRIGGACVFTAGNRLQIMEPHYHLPLLSVIPKAVAHYYLRATGKGSHYYERHRSYWGLKDLVRNFVVEDYTTRIIAEPEEYEAEYMITNGSIKQRVANFIATHMYWCLPTYIWLLRKP